MFFQITGNEIISGVCKSIYTEFGDSLNIYKEKEQTLELPGVTVYCINYDKVMERYDRFTNTFDIIINYFPTDNIKIVNNRSLMYSEAERIANAIRYIELPAYSKDTQGDFVETTLQTKGHDISIEEKLDGFMQVSVKYIVRTKELHNNVKMEQIDIDVTNKNIGGI